MHFYMRTSRHTGVQIGFFGMLLLSPVYLVYFTAVLITFTVYVLCEAIRFSIWLVNAVASMLTHAHERHSNED